MIHPLQAWLDKHGLSQTKLADELGITRQYVSNIVNGKRPSPRVGALIVQRTKGEISLQELMYPEGLPPFEVLREIAV
jgi:transcriptional regulator with XRE-family HTH domain